MGAEVPLRRRHLVAMNGSSVGLLTVGLANTLLIPKMAIDALGIEEYGRFAFLLGFCFIPTIVDFGLMPGLTREVGRLHAANRTADANALILRFQTLFSIIGAVIVVALAVGLARCTQGGVPTLVSVLAGGGANVAVMVTDAGMIVRRVQGRIIAANATRATYYVAYLLSVWAAFALGRISVVSLFYGQATGALAYALVGWFQYGRGRPVPAETARSVRIPWRALWKTALPEQVARAQGAFLPGAERTLILAAGGASQLAAYDLALRLSVVVTALPAVIAEPVLALLSTRMHSSALRERELILRYATRVTYAVTGVAMALATLLSLYWAEAYYRLGGTSFQIFAVLVMLGSGFNALTATPVAGLYSAGTPFPVLAKTLGDVMIAGIGLGVVAMTAIPVAYVEIRYLGYFLTAGGLLLFWRNFRRKKLAGSDALAQIAAVGKSARPA